MADPTDRGWWARTAGPPPQPELRSTSKQRPLAILAASIAVVVALALVSGAFSGGAAPAPVPARSGSGDPWSSALGVHVRSAYLASCQSAGGGSAYCACVFSQITAQAPYSTPQAFAVLSAAAQRAQRANDLAAIPAAVTQANDTCSTPAAGPPSTKHAV